MDYRILVTGSRDWEEPRLVRQWVGYFAERARCAGYGPKVVHGYCRKGADEMCDRFCREQGIAVERHPAIWRPFGIYNPQAGLLRNREMVDQGAFVCLAFIRNGSPGATHCADLAEAAGIPTRRYTA
jgi:hypothetical protein